MQVPPVPAGAVHQLLARAVKKSMQMVKLQEAVLNMPAELAPPSVRSRGVVPTVQEAANNLEQLLGRAVWLGSG
jgi:hypothetical protein